jgi:parvulin-like peptidyl-prolyl isomerase
MIEKLPKIKLPKFKFDLKTLNLPKVCGSCMIACQKFLVRMRKTTVEAVDNQPTKKMSPVAKIVLASIALLLFLVITYFGVMIYAFKAQDKVTLAAAKFIPYPVALVNAEFVTYNDYASEVRYIHHFYTANEQAATSDFKTIDRQILDQLIENKLVEQQAKKVKIKVTKSDEDGVIDNIINQNGGKEKVEKVLSDMYGININQFRSLVRVQLFRDKLNEKMIAKVDAQHILIKAAKDAPQADIDAAKVKIDSIAAEIKGGLDFAEAAKKYSEDSGSAANGGTLEPFSKGEMVQAFSDTAFATNVGEVSAPVLSEYGWHIIKVNKKTGTIDESFASWIAGVKNKSLILNILYGKNSVQTPVSE